MACASISVQWRLKGNDHYKSVFDDLSPVIKIDRYQKALSCYERAFSTTTSVDEMSSSAKNYGMTSWKLGKLAVDSCEHLFVIKRYFKEALKHFNKAYAMGLGNKTYEWRDNVLAQIRGCWEDASTATDDSPTAIQEECIDLIPCDDMKADCFMELAEFHLHRGLKAIAHGDFKVCLNEMHNCYYPLSEAIRYGHGIKKIRHDHARMETDVITHTAIAESTQSRVIGDALLEKLLLDEETLNIDMVWEVIDWYKKSILKTRDLDMKLEAIALSKIGIVYEKLLKIRFRAKIYFNKALEIAQSLTPRDFTNEDWYKKCTETLEMYQRETVQHEQEEDRKAKADVLKKLAPDIKELNNHSSDYFYDFLIFIYKKYPRKNSGHEMAEKKEEISPEKRKKLLQQAIIHYHPDRVKVDEDGLEAKVLCEEITKRLTARYERTKI